VKLLDGVQHRPGAKPLVQPEEDFIGASRTLADDFSDEALQPVGAAGTFRTQIAIDNRSLIDIPRRQRVIGQPPGFVRISAERGSLLAAEDGSHGGVDGHKPLTGGSQTPVEPAQHLF